MDQFFIYAKFCCPGNNVEYVQKFSSSLQVSKSHLTFIPTKVLLSGRSLFGKGTVFRKWGTPFCYIMAPSAGKFYEPAGKIMNPKPNGLWSFNATGQVSKQHSSIAFFFVVFPFKMIQSHCMLKQYAN